MIKEFLPKSIICFKEGYPLSKFKKDLIAGITVGIVALPLPMHALKDFYLKRKADDTLLLSGVTAPVDKSLRKYGLEALIGKEHLFTAFKPALALAKRAVGPIK